MSTESEQVPAQEYNSLELDHSLECLAEILVEAYLENKKYEVK